MEILNKIRSSADVKELSIAETLKLCDELRQEIITDVSYTGGHLASNLGAVELTVALHRVFDTSKDRIVFDVGHQCYPHKMLTGRLSQFNTLRKYNGLSGFPKPCESVDDPCIVGHASTSISNALGMARARTLKGDKYNVCAVIGDGALTGGLAYEGLCDCGSSREPIIVILNDNNMSIGHNVGGLSELLSGLRVRQSYMDFKTAYRKTVGRTGGLYEALHKVKEGAKNIVLPDNMFEDMGFYYLGPIDGHDEQLVERALRYSKSLGVPVLLHVLTVKGKGYIPAEKNPAQYHGVGAFDVSTGISSGESTCFSSVFGDALCEIAENNDKVVAITAAMADGTGLLDFKKKYRKRFFDVGIAEEHAVSMAAGLAAGGAVPVFAVYSSFLQRSYDMLIHDVSISNLHVVLAVDRAGLVGADGETHHGSFDVNYLRTVPGMTLLSPSNYSELRSMLTRAVDMSGPVAVRYPRGTEGAFIQDTSDRDYCILRDGSGPVIITYGILVNNVLDAADRLSADGTDCMVIKLNRLSADVLDYSLLEGKNVVFVEDCASHGCMGEEIISAAKQSGIETGVTQLLNLGNGIVTHGSVPQLWEQCWLDSNGIYCLVKELTEK